jgi:hypothetical protein
VTLHGRQSESASEILRAKVAPVLAEVSARSALMVEHERPQMAYTELLRLLHSMVRANVPLLRTAEVEASRVAQSDLVGASIVEYLHDRSILGRDHADSIQADYAATGADPADLDLAPGSPTVAAMVGSIYYWVLHAHPVAVLGYCAIFEATPPSHEFVDRLEICTGFVPGAFNSLRRQSVRDVNRADVIFGLIDGLPLTTGLRALINMAALQTADLLVAAGDELLERADMSVPASWSRWRT